MSEAYIVRRYVSRDFTHLDNALIRDKSISWKALGILVYLLSLPPDYRLRLCHLSSLRKSGRDATRAGLKELEAAGYLSIERKTDEGGRFSATVWRVSDVPFCFPRTENPNTVNPTVEKPETGKPALEKPTLLRTNKQQELKRKRTKTNNLEEDEGVVPATMELMAGFSGLSRDDLSAISQAISSLPESEVKLLLGKLSEALAAGNVIRTTPGRWFTGVVRAHKAKAKSVTLSVGVAPERARVAGGGPIGARDLALAQMSRILGGRAPAKASEAG